ncbi:hypothetical protein [Clostridium kluyveri]|uniref:hypothetical protein n=1 Tax=Clostridium kluyveri TaxID=1534 RepID=UPI0011D0D4AF|nr:hypothetical protein [Clostridium kluyveri]
MTFYIRETVLDLGFKKLLALNHDIETSFNVEYICGLTTAIETSKRGHSMYGYTSYQWRKGN